MEITEPRHTIFDSKRFDDDRAKISGFLHKGMKATGGTDIDWLIERNGGFIIFETKGIHDNHISIKKGQMFAFKRLYRKLNSDGKCYYFIIGLENVDFSKWDSIIYYFEMKDWDNGKIPSIDDTKYKKFKFHKKDMKKITLRSFRELLDKCWTDIDKRQS